MLIDSIEERKIYWGGIDNTIIPTMADSKAMQEYKIKKKKQRDEAKADKDHEVSGEKSVKIAERERLEKKKAQKEQAAADALHLKETMKMTGLESRLSDLQDKIGKVVKVNGRMVFQMSRDFKLAGLGAQNIVSVGKKWSSLMQQIAEHTSLANTYLDTGREAYKKITDELDKHNEKWLIINKESQNYTEEVAGHAKAGSELNDVYRDVTKTLGVGLRDVADIQVENINNSLSLAKAYKKIGTAGFTNQVEEMKDAAEKAQLQADIIKKQTIPSLKIQLKIARALVKAAGLDEDLQKMILSDLDEQENTIDKMSDGADVMVATAQSNVDAAKMLAKINGQVAAGSEAILGPFKKLQSILESNPLGKWVSTLVGLDDKMKGFGDYVRGELLLVLSEPKAKLVEWTDEAGNLQQRWHDGTGFVAAASDEAKAGHMSFKEAFDNIMEKGLETFKTITAAFKQFNAALSGMLGPILIGLAAIILIVAAMKKLYGGTLELRKEMGLTFGHAAELQKSINMTATQFSFLGVEASDVQSIVSGIQDSMGGVGEATDELLVSMARLNADFGIAGGSAATLVTQMKAVGAASDQAAISQLESVGYLAQASGVAPAAIMDSVAENTEAFAGFAKDGGKNLFKAAIAAKKLGVEFSSIMDAAEGLLDFESSIESSMEASMLLGRNINTDLAREMAFRGDIEGMQKEILRQAGSQADFEKMNVLQRKALAKAFGLSVSEMSSMISNQEKLNNMTAGEKRTRDQINAMLEYAGEIWAQILSITTKLYPIILGIAGALAIAFLPITLAVAGISFLVYWASKLVDILPGVEYVIGAIALGLGLWKMHAMGIGIFGKNRVKDLVKEFMIEKGITKEKQKQVVAETAETTAETAGGGADLATSAIPDTKTVPKKGIGDKLKDLAKGLKAMAGGKVLQGALNLIPTGLGFLLLLPGLPGLLILGKAKLTKIGPNLISLGVGLKGMAGKKVAMGALNLVAASVAFALAIASIPFLGFIAMVGTTAAAGLVALGGGLETLGAAAATGFPFIAVGLIALLGVAMIPFGYALKLAAPFVTAIAEGLVSLSAAGAGLITLALGIGAIGLALAGWGTGAVFIGIGIAMLTAFSVVMMKASKGAGNLSSSMEKINEEMEKTIKNKEQYEGFLEGFSKTTSPLKKLGKKLGESLWSGFGMAGLIAESPSRMGERIRDGIAAIGPGLLDLFGRLFDGIGSIFSGLGGFFKGIWDGILAGGKWLWDGITAGFNWVVGKVGEGWEWVKGAASDTWEWVKGAASDTWEWVKGAWGTLSETLAPAFEGLSKGATTAWEGIKGGALSVWEGIKAGWDAGSFGPVWEGLKSGASQAFGGIIEGAGQAWDGLKSSATIAAEHVSNAWAGAKEAVSKGWDKAKGLANKAWEGLKSIWPFARGGVVSKPGNRPQYFAQGTDTIPAMLTPGEMVLNQDQQTAVGGAMAGGGTDTAALEAKVDRLIAAIESGNTQLSTIAGNTGEFADAVIR